jgi:hypothetical protein
MGLSTANRLRKGIFVARSVKEHETLIGDTLRREDFVGNQTLGRMKSCSIVNPGEPAEFETLLWKFLIGLPFQRLRERLTGFVACSTIWKTSCTAKAR